MFDLLWGDATNPGVNDAMAAWCAKHIGVDRLEAPYTTMGVFEAKTLIAVVTFNNFHRKAGVIELHGASISARWMPRPVLYEMFSYPFDRLGCQMVVMRVSERNTRLLRILSAYGFDHVTVPRMRGRDEAERLFTLTEEAWRANGFHKHKETRLAA